MLGVRSVVLNISNGPLVAIQGRLQPVPWLLLTPILKENQLEKSCFLL